MNSSGYSPKMELSLMRSICYDWGDIQPLRGCEIACSIIPRVTLAVMHSKVLRTLLLMCRHKFNPFGVVRLLAPLFRELHSRLCIVKSLGLFNLDHLISYSTPSGL